eukprot:TRINITY_DN12243_c0_g1_i2.p1 TRINITY_DN12243_c0_g1~~TRINITY_DN12243_c0_g1_i2.p1  ORF type:complete len:892 (+),score=155.34 TRINITY_DN12243_c0_g1_i2:225-2900(+)
MSQTPGYDRGRLFFQDDVEEALMYSQIPQSAPTTATKARSMEVVRPLSPRMLEERLLGSADVTPSVSTRTPLSKVWGSSEYLDKVWSFWISTWQAEHQELRDLGSFNQIRSFWDWFEALGLPKEKGTSHYLFRNKIRPRWEDEPNKQGGHFTALIHDDMNTANLWLDLTLAVVAGQFKGSDLINGVGICNKGASCTLQIWLASRDKALEDMVSYQLKQKLGGVQMLFKPHNKIKKNSTSTVIEPSPVKDALEYSILLERRRPHSAPPPLTSHDIWADGEADAGIYFGVMSTRTLGVMTPLAGGYQTSLRQVLPAPVDEPTVSPSPVVNTNAKAKKAGIRCLNPDLVESKIEATPSRGRLESRSATICRRSRSGNQSTLCIPSIPILSARKFVPQTTTAKSSFAVFTPVGSEKSTPCSSRGQTSPKDPSGLVPPAGPSPVKNWADSPFNPDSPAWNANSGSGNRGKPLPQVAQPVGATSSGAAGASMWAKKDTHQQQVPSIMKHDHQPANNYSYDDWNDRSRFGGKKGAGKGYRDFKGSRSDYSYEGRRGNGAAEAHYYNTTRDGRSPPPERRGKGYGQGKSSSSAFIHDGYLYPPGLNRKQRRTIIFSNEQRKGEVGVVEGFWLGENVPDGSVSEEEYALLRTGKLHPSKVQPQAMNSWGTGDGQQGGNGSYDVKAAKPQSADDDLIAMANESSNPIPDQNVRPPQRSPPPHPRVDTAHVRSTSPSLSQASYQSDLPSPPALGPPISQLSHLQHYQDKPHLNPEAAAFFPKDAPPNSSMEPPALLNGVPYVSKSGHAGFIQASQLANVHPIGTSPSQPPLAGLPQDVESKVTPPHLSLTPPMQGLQFTPGMPPFQQVFNAPPGVTMVALPPGAPPYPPPNGGCYSFPQQQF